MGQKATQPSRSESEALPSFEQLALLGHSSAEDESVEEFAVMLRKWRDEGAFSKPTQ